MSRIDEIKERAGKTALHQEEWADNYRGDIQYLLSRLEIAEKALEEAKDKTTLAVNKMCGGGVERHIFEETRSAYYAISEALQQIRS